MKKGEILLSAVCVAFFSFMFYEAVKLHGVGRFGEVGSGFWPMLSLGVSVILSLMLVDRRPSRPTSKAKDGTVEEPLTGGDCLRHGVERKKVALSIVCLFGLRRHHALDRFYPVDLAFHTCVRSCHSRREENRS